MRLGQGQRVVGTVRQQGTGVATFEGAVGKEGRRGGVRALSGQCDAGWHEEAKDRGEPHQADWG